MDVMTYVFTKISGIPENQIIGSGTVLDSARLRCGLSEHFKVAQRNIHAYDNVRIFRILILACDDSHRISETGSLLDIHNLAFYNKQAN